MGRYIPPEAVDSGDTRFNKSHPLGSRARKIGQGILTVRFEMPYAIWCLHCQAQTGKETIIGQGVRFNAEKKKVGMYHSSAIWSFRMKHTPCGGWIEIRTDPKNTEYVVTEGARKRDHGSSEQYVDGNKVGMWGQELLTEEERERRRNDAFAQLEVKIQDQVQVKEEKTRLDDLKETRDKHWEDPYTASQRLRRGFRAERKARKRLEGETEALKDRLSLGIDLLQETEEDRARASLVEFGRPNDLSKTERAVFDTTTRARGDEEHESKAAALKTLKERDAARKRQIVQTQLRGNTRAALDPFAGAAVHSSSRPSILGLKKRQPPPSTPSTQNNMVIKQPSTSPDKTLYRDELRPSALVAYESD